MPRRKRPAKRAAAKNSQRSSPGRPSALRPSFALAVDNVVRYGDTDIFPFPMENFVFADNRDDVLELLDEIHRNFKSVFNLYPPANYSTLAAVGYQGFRWATQLDPIWNAYLLGLVVSIGELIEGARLPVRDKTIFSYRFKPSISTKSLFDPAVGWREFQARSRELANKSDYVLQCDISDFYPRVYHHRLENALMRVAAQSDTPRRIMDLLQHFARNASYSLPVGGPAARLLSELLLNATDRLLMTTGIMFCRFADDYRIFTTNQAEAYKALVFLSEKLLKNEGLSLQRSKTKILSRSEFLQLTHDEAVDDDERENVSQAARFMRLRLFYDPYSPSAAEDFEHLKREIGQFDILSMLRSEIGKSQVDISLTRRLVQAARHMPARERESVAVSLIESSSTLAPIYPQILMFTKQTFKELSESVKQQILEFIRRELRQGTPATALDLNVAYMIRVLAEEPSTESETLLIQLFQNTASPIVRRDIIYVLALWGATYWLSDVRNDFQSLSAAERRAFIVGSYCLRDEGSHWRDHTRDHFSPFERIMMKWYARRSKSPSWRLPI